MSKNSEFGMLDDDELIALIKIDVEKENLDKALIKIKCLSDKKTNKEGLSIAAKVYAQLALFDKAKTCYEAFLKSDKSAVTERFQLGMVLFDSGNSKDAFNEWEKVLKQEPTHPPTLFYKGLSQANENKFAEAQNTLTILLQSAPSDNLYFGRAKNLMESLGKDVESESNNAQLAATAEDAYKSIN